METDQDRAATARTRSGNHTRTETTYSYAKGWHRNVISSGAFQRKAGHENPTSKAIPDLARTASQVMVGAFTLPHEMLRRLDDWERLPLEIGGLPAPLPDRFQLDGDRLFMGDDPTNPKVGDLRVTHHVVRPCIVSIVALQQGSTFAPYQTKAGDRLSMIRSGEFSATRMFDDAITGNTVLTWAIRLGGFVMMFIGLLLLASPLQFIVSWIPLVRDVLGIGIGLFAFGASVVTSLAIVAAGWFVYRPMVSMVLLGVAGVTLLLMMYLGIVGRRGLRGPPAMTAPADDVPMKRAISPV